MEKSKDLFNLTIGKIFNLIEVRKIIALSITFVFCYLALNKIIKSNEFLPIATMVMGYYFGKSTALDNPKDKGVK